MAVGRGDEHDARTKARGVTASFSLNGLSLPGGVGSCGAGGGGILVGGATTENLENSGNPPEPDDQPVDLYRENEELKVHKTKKKNQIFLVDNFRGFPSLFGPTLWNEASRREKTRATHDLISFFY